MKDSIVILPIVNVKIMKNIQNILVIDSLIIQLILHIVVKIVNIVDMVIIQNIQLILHIVVKLLNILLIDIMNILVVHLLQQKHQDLILQVQPVLLKPLQ